MNARGVIAVISLVIIAAVPASAGWKAVDKEGAITLISNGKFKHVSPKDGMGSISDSGKGTITMVNNREGVYVTGKPHEFCQEMKAMMNAALASIPPEQRAMMEEMMKSSAAAAKPAVSFKKAGSGGKIAGWDTDRYEVFVNGKLYEELWLVTDKAILNDLDKLDIGLFQKFSSCMANQSGGNHDPEDSPEYIQLLKKGWQVKSVPHGDVHHHLSETISLEKTDVPESEFDVPAGYRKVTVMEMFSMGPE